MIEFTHQTIGDTPALIAKRAGLELPAPTVLWFHGLGVDKETHRKELTLLAEAGFVAIGIDSAGHGERRLPNLSELIDAPREQAFATATELAFETAREVPALVAHLIENEIADARHIALAGISMGAFILYRAIIECPGISKAVAILGSPKFPHALSPHRHPEAFCATELLSITAECDENVPPGPARDLHLQLEEICPAKHRYVELPGAVHLMNGEDWERTVDEMMLWLQR